jgi:hypothetical protein
MISPWLRSNVFLADKSPVRKPVFCQETGFTMMQNMFNQLRPQDSLKSRFLAPCQALVDVFDHTGHVGD